MHAHRNARREDLEQIVQIYNSTIASRKVTADTAAVTVHSRIPWFEEHEPESRPIWVCEEDGVVTAWLGFSNFYGRPAYDGTAEVSLYVRESHRNQGLGAYLLGSAVRQAPELGIDTLLGFVFGDNTASLALFERFGFGRWGCLPKVARFEDAERDLVVVGRRVSRGDMACNAEKPGSALSDR